MSREQWSATRNRMRREAANASVQEEASIAQAILHDQPTMCRDDALREAARIVANRTQWRKA